MAIVKLASASLCRRDDYDPELRQQISSDVQWLLCNSQNHESEVITGEDAGMLLNHYISKKGWDILGEDARRFDHFPYTIALLSNSVEGMIQVNAQQDRESFWFVEEADDQAWIDLGVTEELSQEDFVAALQQGTLSSLLNRIPVKAGDVFAVEAGVMFAVSSGVKLIEIKKNAKVSDEQIDLSSVIQLRPLSHDHAHNEWLQDGQAEHTCLERNDVFDVDLYELNGRLDLEADHRSFLSLVVTDGTAVIDKGSEILHAQKNDCFFVDAGTEPFHITGNCQFLLVSLTDK